MVPAAEAHLAIFDLGVVMGATVTEMTRTFHRRPWRLGDHLDRLYRSLKYTRMNVRETKDELAAVAEELVAHNGRSLPDGGELGIVHFVTAGEHPVYADSSGRAARTLPTVCVHTFPLRFERWAR